MPLLGDFYVTRFTLGIFGVPASLDGFEPSRCYLSTQIGLADQSWNIANFRLLAGDAH